MNPQPLSQTQVRDFIDDGFVRIDHVFPRETAAEALGILWRDTGCDPNDSATWTKPVIRLGDYGQPPFRNAVNAPILRLAFDQLVGERRWLARSTLGTFPIRFPSSADPGDAGWHIDRPFAPYRPTGAGGHSAGQVDATTLNPYFSRIERLVGKASTRR
jgi:hypothetical protein